MNRGVYHSLVIEQQLALIEALEKNEIPKDRISHTLAVLSVNILYMNKDMLQRFQKLQQEARDNTQSLLK